VDLNHDRRAEQRVERHALLSVHLRFASLDAAQRTTMTVQGAWLATWLAVVPRR
jgi:hypothetical protein